MCCDFLAPPIAVFNFKPLKKLFTFTGPPTHSLKGSNIFSATNSMLSNCSLLGTLSNPNRVAVALNTPSLYETCLLIIII